MSNAPNGAVDVNICKNCRRQIWLMYTPPEIPPDYDIPYRWYHSHSGNAFCNEHDAPDPDAPIAEPDTEEDLPLEHHELS